MLNNSVENEITTNSLEYGVAVNTDRSIPDAMSGLKPVAKRILYDAYIEGRSSDKPHTKSARIVGDVMGRFHPHGDSSIYGAMIRLSQDWVMRYPLIDIHGNNGTVLGDGPAAMRYTEARLSKIAEDGLLTGLKKNMVDYGPNYDESEDEPITLPSIFPNLLCNPNEGIGWAMGCTWAPHNLREVAAAINQYINNEEPMLPGPDFPTGGVIINKDDIPDIMRTGKGSVRIRGQYKIEKNSIVFYEIPYGTRVESLMDEIGAACDEEKITGIDDVRNETNKKVGIRLVIDVNKNHNAGNVLRQLFSKTNLQTIFSYNQVALIDKVPTEMNLKDAIQCYVAHNTQCIVREAMFDIDKATKRLHIILGLIKALDIIDEVIAMIKASASAAAASTTLQTKWGFSEEQAKAILDMKLSKLAKLEKDELLAEKVELDALLIKLAEICEKPIPELQKRLQNIVDKYGDDRRTVLDNIVITKEEKEIVNVEPEKCVVVMSASGLIKRIPADNFKTQSRNGKGVKTGDDITTMIIRTNTIDNLMVFTNKGRMYRLLVDKIPVGTNTTQGVPVSTLVDMGNDEYATVIYSIYRDTDAKFVFFITKSGMIKKVALTEYIDIRRKTGIAATSLRDGDELVSVFLMNEEPIVILTKGGMGIKIDAKNVSIGSRISLGVKGITLKEDDCVATAMPIRNANDSIAIFSENGSGKKIASTELSFQNRGGKGLICYKPSAITGNVVAGAMVSDEDSVLIMGDKSSICVSAKDIPSASRAALGVMMIKGSKISSVSKV